MGALGAGWLPQGALGVGKGRAPSKAIGTSQPAPTGEVEGPVVLHILAAVKHLALSLSTAEDRRTGALSQTV